MARTALTLTLEPVGACNLGCGYCYAAKADASPPETALFLRALEQVARYAADAGFAGLDCVWLGGEPLLAGHAFFERMAEGTAKASSGVAIRHFMQTNGLLLDAAYCRLLTAMGVRLGLSLDGPQDVHDAFRRTSRGGPTFSRVMETVALLRRHEVAFGCVAVVTSRTLGREAELYDFFCDLGCGFRINPVIPVPGAGSPEAWIEPEDYGRNLVRFFDVWNVSRPDRVNISPLDNYVMSLAGGELRECQQRPSCAGLSLGLKPNGDVVRCGRFQNQTLGNLKKSPLEALLGGPAAAPFEDRPAGLTACHGCPFWRQCHGGCPHNAVAFGRGIEAKDPFCPAFKMIFSHIKATLSL